MHFFVLLLWVIKLIKIISTIIEELFLTRYGKFNWVSVTALVAIGAFVWSVVFNKRQLRADLISKSRISWMTKVRDLYAEYVKYFGIYRYDYDQFEMEKIGTNEHLTEEMSNIRALYYKLKLYIPDNASNFLLLKNIELIWTELSYIQDFYNYGEIRGYIACRRLKIPGTDYDRVTNKYLDQLILNAVADGSVYFGKEWNKAKSGE